MSEGQHSDSDFLVSFRTPKCYNYLLIAKQQKESHYSNQEIKKFITSQQQENTEKKTTYDMNVFQRFLNECGEK